MLHSPEPWRIEQRVADGHNYETVVDANGLEVTGAQEYGGDCYDCSAMPCILDANCARIVSAVNALAGIPACDLPKVRALWDAHAGFTHSLAKPWPSPTCGPAGPMPPLDAGGEK